MPSISGNSSTEKDQLSSIVRKLMIDADEFFVQEQKTLQLSYAELNNRIDQLRMRVQQRHQQASGVPIGNAGYSSANPSPFSTVHSLPNTDTLSLSGTGQGVLGGGNTTMNIGLGNINATPLRAPSAAGGQGMGSAITNNNQNGTSRSLLSSLNGPNGALGTKDGYQDSVRPVSAHSGGGISSPFANGGSAGTGSSRGAYRVDAVTPPSKHLTLSHQANKSLSMSYHHLQQPQPLSCLGVTGPSVLDDTITSEYFSTAPNNASTSSHYDSLMASPQATQKLSLEELIGRFNATTTNANAASAAFNFDSLYEQLTSGGPEESSQSPVDYNEQAPVREATPYERAALNTDCRDTSSPDTGLRGCGAMARNSIPVDSLRAVHDQHLTTSVRVVYEHGRPTVVRIPGGAPDTPDSLGINPRSGCEVLVEFKRKRVLQYESHEYVAPGSYVIVGGDRGEDLGLVVYAWCEVSTEASRSSGSASEQNSYVSINIATAAGNKRQVVGVGLTDSKLPRSMGVGNGTVLRIATEVEVQQLLGTQAELERRAIDVCAQLVLDHSLPMVIVDAEYQFDKKKLTFFYEAQQRMDFRELVRHLYKTFRARIWMELVDA